MLNNNRLGFCSWSVRPENIDELISAAKQIGLARIQLALNPLSDNPGDDGRAWWNAALRLRDAGITVKSGMFGTVGEDYATIARIHENRRRAAGRDLARELDEPAHRRAARRDARHRADHDARGVHPERHERPGV